MKKTTRLLSLLLALALLVGIAPVLSLQARATNGSKFANFENLQFGTSDNHKIYKTDDTFNIGDVTFTVTEGSFETYTTKYMGTKQIVFNNAKIQATLPNMANTIVTELTYSIYASSTGDSITLNTTLTALPPATMTVSYHTHEFYADWRSDENGHWHDAKCGHNVTSDEGEHADSDTDTDHNCDTCGYKMGDHTFSADWSSDENNHWHDATCGHDVKSDETNHTFSTEWKYDENNHWEVTTCTDKCGYSTQSVPEPHVDGGTDNACNICKAPLMKSTIVEGGKTLEVKFGSETRTVTLKVDGASIQNPFTATLEGLDELAKTIGQNVTAEKFVYKYSETGKNYQPIDPNTFTPKEGYYQVGVLLKITPRTRAVSNTTNEQTYELYVQYTVTNPTTTAATGDSRPIELVMTAMVLFGAVAAAAYALDNKGKFFR